MCSASLHRMWCSLPCSLLAFSGMKNAHHVMFMAKRKSGNTLVYTTWKHKGERQGGNKLSENTGLRLRNWLLLFLCTFLYFLWKFSRGEMQSQKGSQRVRGWNDMPMTQALQVAPTCSQTLGFRVKWLAPRLLGTPSRKKTSHVPHAQGKPKGHVLLIPLGQQTNAAFRRQVQDNLRRVSCSPEKAGSYWMFCEHPRATATQHRAVGLRRQQQQGRGG